MYVISFIELMLFYCSLFLFLSRKRTEPNHLYVQSLGIHQDQFPSLLEPGK